MSGWKGPLLATILAGTLAYFGATAAIPGFIMGKATDGMAARGGYNKMTHGALSSPENQPIVRPSPDLAYSSCPFDVSAGPVSVNVVPVPDRYSSLSVFDANTDVVFVRNDMQAKNQPYRIVIAREGQSTPPGAEVVRVKKDRGIALIRLLLADRGELSKVQVLREQTSCGRL